MKRTVRYIKVRKVQVGQRGWVMAADHPRDEFNGEWVHTSAVQGIIREGERPVFETLNHIYEPLVGEKPTSLGFLERLRNIISEPLPMQGEPVAV